MSNIGGVGPGQTSCLKPPGSRPPQQRASTLCSQQLSSKESPPSKKVSFDPKLQTIEFDAPLESLRQSLAVLELTEVSSTLNNIYKLQKLRFSLDELDEKDIHSKIRSNEILKRLGLATVIWAGALSVTLLLAVAIQLLPLFVATTLILPIFAPASLVGLAVFGVGTHNSSKLHSQLSDLNNSFSALTDRIERLLTRMRNNKRAVEGAHKNIKNIATRFNDPKFDLIEVLRANRLNEKSTTDNMIQKQIDATQQNLNEMIEKLTKMNGQILNMDAELDQSAVLKDLKNIQSHLKASKLKLATTS